MSSNRGEKVLNSIEIGWTQDLRVQHIILHPNVKQFMRNRDNPKTALDLLFMCKTQMSVFVTVSSSWRRHFRGFMVQSEDEGSNRIESLTSFGD